ncbi:MAG: lipoprotein [Gammaproteobacteria bacterium]|nr:lipoprotein [Gammaproteobacteria bacterium]
MRRRGTPARHTLLLACVLHCVLLVGCGQKGDLYLPDENPENAARR